jgi:hypothetical protein
MANRILTVLACCLLAVLGVWVVAINFPGKPPATGSARPVPPGLVITHEPVQPAPSLESAMRGAAQTDVATRGAPLDDPVSSPPPKKMTWAEVEDEFDRLRKERGTRPEALHELSGWYDRIASPEFTQSKSLLDHFERLKPWRDERPESVTRQVILAKAHLRYAWEARGGGWAFTVTDEGWEKFHGRVAEARRLLEEATAQGVKDGEAYALLVEVAKAEGLPEEQARVWLKQGQELDPTYLWMYARMAEFLLPRWHGEPGDVESFAAEMARTLPGDDGLDAFGHVAWQINHYEPRTLWWGEYDRELLGKAAKVLADRYRNFPRLVNFAGLCAYAAQDHDAARQIRPLIGPFNKDDRIWHREHLHEHFLKWAAAPQVADSGERWIWGATTGCPSFAFAPDGNTIWCAQQYSGDLHQVDIASGTMRLLLPGPKSVLNDAEFDRAGRWIVTAQWREPFTGWIYWNMETDDARHHPTPEQVRAVAVHPLQNRITWAESKTVLSIDFDSGEEVLRFSLPDYVHQLEYSPDGKRLFVKTGKQYVCDSASGDILYELPGGNSSSGAKQCAQFLAFDELGRVYSTAFNRSPPESDKCLVRGTQDGADWEVLIPKIGAGVASLTSDRSRLAVADKGLGSEEPSGIEVWDIAGAGLVQRLGGHWTRIESLQFSNSGTRLASQGKDGLIKIWDIPNVPSQP